MGAGRQQHHQLDAPVIGCRRLALAMVLSTVACLAVEDAQTMRTVLPRVAANMQRLTTDRARESTPDERAYFSFYGLDLPPTRHHFGFFEHDGRRIAGHIYTVDPARGTVLLLHGYYDHSGVLAGVAGSLTAAGFNVVVYDQPGHGLSEGERASIDDFGDYGRLFLAAVEKSRHAWGLPAPLHVVAHSMGCAAVLDVALRGERLDVAHVVFIAPLVRSKHWRLAGVGHALASPFADETTRVFRRNSSDKAFRVFVRNDPLQARVVPFAWVQAHRDWYEAIQDAPSAGLSPVILQGGRDNVVDARYNLRFLRRKLPRCRIVRYPKGGHQLMNETAPLRETVLDDIRQALLPES